MPAWRYAVINEPSDVPRHKSAPLNERMNNPYAPLPLRLVPFTYFHRSAARFATQQVLRPKLPLRRADWFRTEVKLPCRLSIGRWRSINHNGFLDLTEDLCVSSQASNTDNMRLLCFNHCAMHWVKHGLFIHSVIKKPYITLYLTF